MSTQSLDILYNCICPIYGFPLPLWLVTRIKLRQWNVSCIFVTCPHVSFVFLNDMHVSTDALWRLKRHVENGNLDAQQLYVLQQNPRELLNNSQSHMFVRVIGLHRDYSRQDLGFYQNSGDYNSSYLSILCMLQWNSFNMYCMPDDDILPGSWCLQIPVQYKHPYSPSGFWSTILASFFSQASFE